MYPVFTTESFEKDVYSFEITLESGDETFVIPLQGVQGGFGSLRNLQPVVGTMINIVKSPSDQVLITATDIQNAGPKNGSGSLEESQYLQDLKYYLIKNPTIPNANALPTNWSMNGGNGEFNTKYFR